MNKTTILCSEINGEGPPLLVIHGFTGDRSTMSSIAEPLSEDYSVVCHPCLVLTRLFLRW